MDVKRTAYEEHKPCVECKRLKAASFLNEQGVCEICQQPPFQMRLLNEAPRRRHFREEQNYFKHCANCRRRVDLYEPYAGGLCMNCWPAENRAAYYEIWKLYNRDIT